MDNQDILHTVGPRVGAGEKARETEGQPESPRASCP